MTEQEWLASDDPQAMMAWLLTVVRGVTYDNPTIDAGQSLASVRQLRLFACACCRHPGVWERLSGDGLHVVLAAESYLAGTGTDLTNDAWEYVQAVGWNQCEETMPKAVVADILREIVGNPFREWWVECGETFRGKRAAKNRQGAVQPLWALQRRRDRQNVLLRDWLTPQVLSLAQAAYEERARRECEKCRGKKKVDKLEPYNDGYYLGERKVIGKEKCHDCGGAGRIDDGMLDPFRLVMLADALEEAGCVGGECRTCGGSKVITQDHPFGDTWATETLGCLHCEGGGREPHPLLAHLRSPGPHYRGCWVIDMLLGKS